MLSSRAYSFLRKPFLQKPSFISHAAQRKACIPKNCLTVSSFHNLKLSTYCKTMADTRSSDYLVWVDLEMTGLDLSKDHIIEMACIITDKDLNVVAEGPNLVIHQPEEVMNGMDAWCTKHHGESGLTKSVLESKISTSEAQRIMKEFVSQYVVPKTAPLAGNSVHADKEFLKKEMPEFLSLLHYRIVDVSTVKELSKRWFPKTFASMPPKLNPHRALDDIKESIAELQWYKKSIFKDNLE